MATNIDKALYAAPLGFEDALDAPDIEIEITDPEEVSIGVDGMEITFGEEPADIQRSFDENLAEVLPENVLLTLVSELSGDIQQDLASRGDWEKTYVEGLKLLGLQREERTEPWNGASGVVHPMITEAVVRFQSETVTETFPAQGPVRTKIRGKETIAKKEAAARVEADMNFELTENMKEFRPEHERMLWSLPSAGSAFKKVYYDPNLGRQVSMFVPAEDMILPYGCSNIHTTHRVTHRLRKTENDIRKLQLAGFYRDIELPSPGTSTTDIQKAKDKETGFRDTDNNDYFDIYESHVDLIIEGEDDDGIALPYVFTFLKGTNDVLAVRRNWRENDPLRLKRQHFVHYQYIPGFGAYGFGLFHLIGSYAHSATSMLRQLIDAGTLSNLPGGLKSRGLRIKGDDTPIAPGEFRDVDIGSGTLQQNIMPLPYKEPSSVLATLLGTIVEEGRRFASTSDMNISDMSAQAPVGTTLALLERQLKVMTAVQARTHNSLKQELQLLAGIIRDYTDDTYEYEPDSGQPSAKKSDYDNVDILPVSDPNAATLSQRVVQYQAVLQMAQMAPEIYDLPQLHRAMLEVMGIKNASKIVPLPEDQKPTDPVTENMNLLKLEPVKAFSYQEHQAHMAVHMALLQDPTIQATIGQNPKASQIQAAIMAHVAEHQGFAYRAQIEQQLGAALPPADDDTPMPPDVERTLSTMLAQAAQQALQQNQAMAAQQQAQQQAQDPVVQMQMQELAIKDREVQIKDRLATIEEQKAKIDAINKLGRLEIDKERNEVTGQLETVKTVAKMQHERATLAANQQQAGARLSADIARNQAQTRQKGSDNT